MIKILRLKWAFIFSVLICSFLARQTVFAAWVESPANPIYDPVNSAEKAYYPSVLKMGAGDYRMWYQSNSTPTNTTVAYATSADGLSWTLVTNAVSGLIPDNAGHPHVEFVDGKFRIWYWNAATPYTNNAIHYAESVDGITWTNDSAITGNLISATGGLWNSGSYGAVDVIVNNSPTNTGANPFDYKYAMYYDATNGGYEQIALGYSADGIAWTLYGSGPVLPKGATGAWDSGYTTAGTVLHEDIWKMWYSGGVSASNEGIGYATSSDGLTWTKSAANPFMSKNDGVAWRNNRTYTPSIINDGGTYKMWFTGKDNAVGNYAIGYATLAPFIGPVFIDTNTNGILDAGEQSFATIQGAVSAASPGDTIHVTAGTYVEVGQIVINKNLTIVGDDKNTTVIKPAADASGSGDAGAWILVNNGITLNLSKVTLDGAGRQIRQAIRFNGNGNVDSVIIQNMVAPGYSGYAIVQGYSNTAARTLSVTNSVFTNFGRVGIQSDEGSASSVVTISGNTFVCKGDGDHLDYAITVEGGSESTITNNTISNCRGVASSDGSTSAGISVTTYFAPGTKATITGNTIFNSTYAIAVGFDVNDRSTVVAHNNNLSGNVHTIDSTFPSVDATNNWWGTVSSTEIASKIIGPVNFTPWLLNNPALATLHIIKLVVNGNGGTATPSGFSVHVKSSGTDVSGSPATGTAAPGTSYSLSPGAYSISENANASYTQSFIGDCDSSGNITLASGDDKICTIVNTDIPPPAPVSGVGGGTRFVPVIGLLKIPTPLAMPSGPGSVTYNYTVWNVGGSQALINVALTDDKCSPAALLSGDTNSNGKLDPGETWRYSCTTTLATSTTDTATVIGHSDDGTNQTAIATAIATVIVATSSAPGVPLFPNTGLVPPLINVVKVPSQLTPLPFGGGEVTYLYVVTNLGMVPMNNVGVTDDKCSAVVRDSGDINKNNLLDPGETWAYFCSVNVPVSTRNIATARGDANGITALGYAFSTVLVSAPNLPNTGTVPPAVSAEPVKTVTANIRQGDKGNNVTSLQQFLISQNQGPAAAALAKIGSTAYFGVLTRAALAEFQAKVGISPASGDFGPLTRAYLSGHY